ncbi:hypothetical protein [Xanthocytophaga agilis]|uniref:Uncharacterized protein n=1 Tax=Xanthocytophaga agilis TaxID=3048010 RepID=A0AAE3RBM3_9BACT|nr:hypothetical protein [Xanthocytophaga agilis]MDJ1505255.1 hypothetical protein [Xanthocytophaga agilis]
MQQKPNQLTANAFKQQTHNKNETNKYSKRLSAVIEHVFVVSMLCDLTRSFSKRPAVSKANKLADNNIVIG